MSDIARLASVHRPTVSTWRRRHADFPSPVGGSETQPIFSSEEVAAWLDNRPFPGQEHRDYGAVFRANQAQSIVGDLTDRKSIDLFTTLTALSTRLHPLPVDRSAIRADAAEVESREPHLAGLFTSCIDESPTDKLISFAHVVNSVTANRPATSAISAVLSSLDPKLSQTGYHATPSNVSDLIATLVGPLDGRSVYDPATGTGALLMRVALSNASEVWANDNDPAMVRLVRLWAAAARVKVSITQTTITESSDPPRTFDVVVVDPPFSSGETRRLKEHKGTRPVDWLRFAHESLSDDGTAYVVVPAWTLTSPTSERNWLSQSGSLRGIIQLPRRVHGFRTGTELAVVVLGRGSPADDVSLWNTDPLAQDNPEHWVTHLSQLLQTGAEQSTVHAVFPLPRLTSCESWLPAHLLSPTTPHDEHEEAANRAYERYESLLKGSRSRVPRLVGGEAPEFGLLTEVATIISGYRLQDTDLEDIRSGSSSAPVLGPPEVRGAGTARCRWITPSTFHKKLELTRPGDIVVLTISGIHTWIDEQGGSVVQAPAQIVRLRTDLGLSARVVARLIAARRNAARATGSIVRRVSLATITIPRFTAEQWQQLDAVFAELDAQRREAETALAAIADLDNALTSGVADGVLAVGHP